MTNIIKLLNVSVMKTYVHRQPEFTQVDIEMSFVDQEDVIQMGEEMLRKVVKDVKGIDVSGPSLE